MDFANIQEFLAIFFWHLLTFIPRTTFWRLFPTINLNSIDEVRSNQNNPNSRLVKEMIVYRYSVCQAITQMRQRDTFLIMEMISLSGKGKLPNGMYYDIYYFKIYMSAKIHKNKCGKEYVKRQIVVTCRQQDLGIKKMFIYLF